MKSFLKYLLFTQDIGFIFFDSYTKKKSFLNLIRFFVLKLNQLNKYSSIYLIREILLKILSIFYVLPGLILFFLKFKFAISNSNSVGSYCEELVSIIGKNNNRYKLILIEPRSYVDNKYLTENYFYKEFIKIKSDFLSIILIPFTYIEFLRITGFENKTNLYFQKQFHNFKTKINNDQYFFDHEILFKNYKKFNENFSMSINKAKQIKNFSHKSKKICVLQIRNLKNIKLRNSSFEKYKKSILYLIKNDYIIYYFSEKDPKFILDNFIFKNLSVEENKRLQLDLISTCDLFIGQISGLFHLAELTKRKMLITDCVIFNHLLDSKNYSVLFKKYKNKEGNYLSYKNIFKNNLQCIWDEKILQLLKINYEDNSEEEIYNALIELLNNEQNINQKIKNYFKKNNIIFPYFDDAIINRSSIFFNEKNFMISD